MNDHFFRFFSGIFFCLQIEIKSGVKKKTNFSEVFQITLLAFMGLNFKFANNITIDFTGGLI